MIRLLSALAMLIALAAPLSAQEERPGIEQTIASQLQAFTDRDVAGAFEYASPGIQGMFGTADNFGMMVERGYPMVWNNAETQFLETREMAGMVIQRILIRDAGGVAHVLDYAMIETESGWKINGVQLIPAPDVGA